MGVKKWGLWPSPSRAELLKVTSDFVGRLNKPIMGYLTLILNVRVKNDQIKEWIIIQNLLKFRVEGCMIYQVSVLF